MKAGAVESKGTRVFAAVVGAMDLLTGIGLVGGPALTLRLMGIVAPTGPAFVYLRWVGVFVGLVGASYLWALGRGGARRLRDVLELTAWCRAAVALFVVAMWRRGELVPAWLAVAATDGLVAAVQAGMVVRGRGGPGHE